MTSKSTAPLFPQQAFFAIAFLALFAPASTALGATVVGDGTEFITDFIDPQGERCDYVAVTGARANITPTKVNGVPKNVRVVFRDRDGDLVVVSLKGAGSITVELEDVTAAADSPNHIFHPCVSGHASLTLSGVDATTSLSVYSVGSTNANQAARPKAGATYQGIADNKRLWIIANGGMIDSLSLANTRFSGTNGVVGITASGLNQPTPVSLLDIEANGDASPALVLPSGSEVAVCGGDLVQPNGRTLQLQEGTTLRFREGSTADGIKLPAIPYTPSGATHPQSLVVAAGQGSTFSAAATGTFGTAKYQWQFNGGAVTGATTATHSVASASSATAGLYAAKVTDAGGSTTTQAAILGLTIPGKLAGATEEIGSNITHQNGRIFDQMLLQGTSASLRADSGQITRLSYIDLTDDIVQIEFSGAGTLTVTLEPGSTGPTAPTNYNQPTVQYMKGDATIVVAGADETTNIAIYSVGAITNPGVVRSDVSYAGWTDVSALAVVSSNGKLGGIRQGNVGYAASHGLTGICAPTVETVVGPVNIHDIDASADATPYLYFAPAAKVIVKICGGDLSQTNGDSITVSGLSQVQMVAGQMSTGTILQGQANKAKLGNESGSDLTSSLVSGP